jgi:hypothetical protein
MLTVVLSRRKKGEKKQNKIKKIFLTHIKENKMPKKNLGADRGLWPD